MPIIDTGALEFAAALAKPMVAQTLAAPGRAIAIPKQLSSQLHALLHNATINDVLALREQERNVSAEDLRLTIR